MILTETVVVKLNTTTYPHWVSKGYTIPTHVDSKKRLKSFRRGGLLQVKVADLMAGSNHQIHAKCVECGTVRKLPFCRYSPVCWSCNLKKQNAAGTGHARFIDDPTLSKTHRAFDLRLRRVFGITAEDYYRRLVEQDNRCKICRRPATSDDRMFAVDHSHATKKVRGLLCQACNTAIGLLKESIPALELAVQYLKDNE